MQPLHVTYPVASCQLKLSAKIIYNASSFGVRSIGVLIPGDPDRDDPDRDDPDRDDPDRGFSLKQ